jgi:hypothetical protein
MEMEAPMPAAVIRVIRSRDAAGELHDHVSPASVYAQSPAPGHGLVVILRYRRAEIRG